MTFDGITTRAVVLALQSTILGGSIKKINQIAPQQLVFQIYAQRTNHQLLLSLDPSSPRIHLTQQKYENPSTPPNFCMLLRKHLGGAKLEVIEQYGLDRTVRLGFQTYNELGDRTEKSLFLELMGKHSNAILLQENGRVLDAIRRVSHDMSRVRQIYPGVSYVPFPSDKFDCLKQSPDLTACIEQAPNVAVANLFSRTLTGFSPLAGRELCRLADIDGSCSAATLTPAEQSRLQAVLDRFVEAIRKGDFRPCLYLTPKPAFYAFPLSHLGAPAQEGDINEILDAYSLVNHREDRLGQKRRSLDDLVRHALEKKAHKYNELLGEYENTENYETYKEEGDLLSANIHTLSRGQTQVEVLDFYHDQVPRTISLQPTKSPWENVEAKYKRHSKLKKSRRILENYLPKLQEEIRYLQQIRQSLSDADSLEIISEIREELIHEQILSPRKKTPRRKTSPSPTQPLTYTSPSGLQVLVGRNNRQNDRLTLRIADRDDVFFHVKDLPGAHVILRTQHRTPTEEDLLFCAQLAAHHSSAREEAYVDVDCTEKKNVYKAKGAKPGMVYYTNFRTLRVAPNNPPSNS